MAGLINIDVGSMAKGITDLLQSKIPTPLDKNKEMELQAQLNTMIVTAMQQSDQNQTAVNLADANSGSKFRAWWRPALAWMCVFGIGWSTIIKSLIEWIGVISGHPVTLPAFDTSSLTTMLVGLLGLGTMRTVEKIKGVA